MTTDDPTWPSDASIWPEDVGEVREFSAADLGFVDHTGGPIRGTVTITSVTPGVDFHLSSDLPPDGRVAFMLPAGGEYSLTEHLGPDAKKRPSRMAGALRGWFRAVRSR